LRLRALATPLLAASALLFLWLALASTASAKTTVAINVPNPDVDLGNKTVVKGALHGDDDRAGLRVFLLGRKFPYKRERIVASTYTGTGGTYFFRVRPTLNTRYRVRYGSVFSDVRRVFVFPSLRRTWVSDADGVASARFFEQFPPDYPLRLAGRRITWYFRKDTNPLYRAIASSRSGATKSKRVTGRVKFQLPNSQQPYSYFVTWCFKLCRPGQDIGIGRNAGGGCPRQFRDDG
jgi:hypothetical protein